MWSWKIGDAFPNLYSDPRVEYRRRPRGEAQFLNECRRALGKLPRSSDLSRPRKELYRGLVEGVAKDPLRKRLDLTEGESLSLWSWAPGADYLDNSEFSLTWRLMRNGLPLNDVLFKMGLADMPDCNRCNSGLEETAQHAFFHCSKVRPFWEYVNEVTARLFPDRPRTPLDVAYVCDNVPPPWTGVKQLVFYTLLAVARMVVWTSRMMDIQEVTSVSHHDLICHFRHQLKVKIRCDRKRLYRLDFNERWVSAVSLVALKGANWEFVFPP